MTEKTRDILVEVTSSQSLEVCKKVVEELLVGLLLMDICDADAAVGPSSSAATPSADNIDTISKGIRDLEASERSTAPTLVVQQVRIVDVTGSLKVMFPSRVDLQSSDYHVIRDYE